MDVSNGKVVFFKSEDCIKLMENDSDSTTGWNGPMSGYKVSFSGSANYGVFNEDSDTGY